MSTESTIFKALGAPHRLEAVRLLLASDRPLCSSDLARLLGVPLYTMSRHLHILRAGGLIEERRQGRHVYYSIASHNGAFRHAIYQAIAALHQRSSGSEHHIADVFQPKDSCGTGFVADLHGRASHRILELAIEAVVNLTHRGAIAADAKTGDGAGILTQIPWSLLQRELRKVGHAAVPREEFAVGVVFLPRESEPQNRCRLIISEACGAHQLQILDWRKVPVDPSVLGDRAAATRPQIEQLLLRRKTPLAPDAFERILYLVRRQIERKVLAAQLPGCYIPSLSSRTIVYKGLVVAPQLRTFYLDLQDPDYTTAIALFHQRYSTNTFPNWFLAQPFRFLGHNGEINTLQGNRNWMRAREPELKSAVWGERIRELLPIIQPGGSDSAQLDNVLELLMVSGRDILHSLMMLIPEAWQKMPDMDPTIAEFFRYHACLTEPWDGPAAITFSDGTLVGAILDRNGLRPARYHVTNDGLVIMASEVGVLHGLDEATIVQKGRLGPGKMLAVDTVNGRLLLDDEIKHRYAKRQPYGEWLKQHLVPLHRLTTETQPDGTPWDPKRLLQQQVAFGYSDEELEMVLKPMATDGKEPVFSMGDDIPLAVLSPRPRPLYMYFKQLFAQVTNPPIDPLREQLVMSLNTIVGARGSLLEATPEHARLLHLPGPILFEHELAALRAQRDPRFRLATLPALFNVSAGPTGLAQGVQHLCAAAAKAVDDGYTLLLVSDRGLSAAQAPLPMLMAVGAVHHHLIRVGTRMKCSLLVETGDAREVHHYACLVGFGASAIYPYVALESIRALVQEGRIASDVVTAFANFRKSVNNGILKIMSKMGISTIGSYRGSQIFEIIGINQDVVEACFAGTASRIGGVGYDTLGRDLLTWHAAAYHPGNGLQRDAGGLFKYRRGSEYHAFNPEMIRYVHQAIKQGDREAYRHYAEAVNHRPYTALRDLLDFASQGPVPLEDVEPIEAICTRFATASISYGALSKEAHETIAIAMNRLGAKSGSGEGGEDPARYRGVIDPQFNKSSAIKQVASARFGVTPDYLMSARELEIKMAQGSKPGEGGQLPGHKVSAEIARVRHTVAGITLISPPPHHDIYSIEDLAQLIYDLKMINPQGRVGVKLVAEAGVGTIAAGVAKGHADTILISGHDGGTGASPLSSIKNAGVPWELGIAETQQTLVANGLRDRVVLRADGGMKTGRDVVIAALLGADEYGFGTAAAVATGCVMTRQCHLNTCPVGVATQDPKLRAKFIGTPEMVVHFFHLVAHEVRELLAAMGARSLDDIIGRVDLLKRKDIPQDTKAATVDLRTIIGDPDPTRTQPRKRIQPRNDWVGDQPLDDQIIRDVAAAIDTQQPMERRYQIRNIHRTVGARLSGVIAQRYTDVGLPDNTITLRFEGTAGQSFGAFLINGVRLILEGEANDYVGKSMAGGEIVVAPSRKVVFATHENVIMGNTVMYGATGGTLYAAGTAGERFCVRNSGGNAVIEGIGDHGCEYMTSGTVVVLGPTGRNFGAGMSGGRAYVFDRAHRFEHYYNPELVAIARLSDEEEIERLKTLIQRHAALTGSRHARGILERWNESLPSFWAVFPKAEPAKLEAAVAARS